MRLVVALGGNALLRRAQVASADNQLANVRVAARQVARVADGNDLVLTHGNGPQVGLLALQSAAYAAVPPYPLDVLDAESQGMLGYLLEQELANLLPPSRAVASLLTRVEVDPLDPAFLKPTKPIGPLYGAAEAAEMARRHRWTMVDAPDGWRRVVPSPRPLRVPALGVIRWLLAHGALVIAAGGGGVPVVPRADGRGLQGVEAVIDKDLCSALLAIELQADLLLIATDVDAVQADWGLPTQRALGRTTPRALAGLPFAAGSMAPKIEAACAFVRATGGRAAIGALGDIEALRDGRCGTQVVPDLA